MARVVLCPGRVFSEIDGQVHEVTAQRLAVLYGVPFHRCLVWDARKPGTCWRPGLDDVLLHPRFDGDYTLPGPAFHALNL